MDFGQWVRGLRLRLGVIILFPTLVSVSSAFLIYLSLRTTLLSDLSKKFEIGEYLTPILLFAVFIGISISLFGVVVAARLANRLSQIAASILSSGLQVNLASNQLSKSSTKLSTGSSEAAASLEETVASVEELSNMVRQNAENSKEANALSISAKGAAQEGETEIQLLIRAMGEIATSSRKIEEIINVIDDIAFQTNLLALNAAVEAARAGEQGKGFAVVADAVRSLAGRSSKAAKDINGLIRDSSVKVERGSKIADASGVVLKNIVTSITKVADLNNEIAAASQEQSQGLTQISRAMSQLDGSTQGNASSAEETAASSEQLQLESQNLQYQVGLLYSLIEGSRAAEKAAEEAALKADLHIQSGHGSDPLKMNFERSKQPKSESLRLQPVPITRLKRAADVIPFDDDVPKAKIGSIDGF